MKKIYLLNSCSTCQRILKEIGVDETWEQQNIKEHNIDEETLNKIYVQTGSYEAIFSKRAMKYKSMGIKEMVKKDADYKPLILKEYTFIKRPIIVIDGTYYIGNSKKNIEIVKTVLNKG